MMRILLLVFAFLAMFCALGSKGNDKRNYLLWALCWFAAASFV